MALNDIMFNLNRWHEEKIAGVTAVGKNISAIAEVKAKSSAIWTDRTANARQGLQGNSFWELATVLKITLAHTVDYGVYLELAHDRKHQILEKTLNSLRGEAFRNIKRIMDK